MKSSVFNKKERKKERKHLRKSLTESSWIRSFNQGKYSANKKGTNETIKVDKSID